MMFYSQVNEFTLILLIKLVLSVVAPEYRSTYKAMFTPEMLNKKVFNRELRCDEQIKLIKEPLLGLNYVIEFQFENLTDPPKYICELCHCKCSLQAILLHLVNIQHQKKFLVIQQIFVVNKN